MPNRLIHESSPYLRQHAHNPVDWWAWGADALAEAKRSDRPILLSIGYAACHWCHVMERESFEDHATAQLMNERFVNIKVDREERPDIDSIYMQAVQAMTGHGGWPMTMFLTPDGTPFYGGTYFPKEDRHGMPSFGRILMSVSDAYATKKEAIEKTTASVREMYEHAGFGKSDEGLGQETFVRALATLTQMYDSRHAGFGGAPKFPPTMVLEWLLAFWSRTKNAQALTMARDTFLAMARGGIYDQIGGGLARYSVDEQWLVPHFEKMLYDNALFVRLGVHLWQATKNDEVRRVVEQTIGWLEREMASPEGGFYSSLDADSEGEEGKFYVWSSEEFDAAMRAAGGDADILALRQHWGVTESGNFEGKNILFVAAASDDRPHASLVSKGVSSLLSARERRVRPARDEKLLGGWNGLMIRAVAEAARAFGNHRSLALRAGEFLLRERVRGDRVIRSVRRGEPVSGVLEDHAAAGLAFISLYELTFERGWLDTARELAHSMVEHFWSDDAEGFYDTPSDAVTLIVRPRDLTDNALPSGNSLAVELLMRIGIVFGDDGMVERARRVVEGLSEPMARHPLAFGHLLGVADMVVNGSIELALVGDSGELARAAGEVYVPSLVIAGGPDSEGIALLNSRKSSEGVAYVCRSYACDAPTGDPSRLKEQLAVAGGHFLI